MGERSGGDSGSGCGCFGCLGFIAFCFVVWSLIFGITIDGTHHDIGCSTERGVEVRHDRGVP